MNKRQKVTNYYGLHAKSSDSQVVETICERVALALEGGHAPGAEELTKARAVLCSGYKLATTATDTEILDAIAKRGIEVICFLEHFALVHFPFPKWGGLGPKLLRDLFRRAQEVKLRDDVETEIFFIDDIDFIADSARMLKQRTDKHDQ